MVQDAKVNANVLALQTLFAKRDSFAADLDAALMAGGTWEGIKKGCKQSSQKPRRKNRCTA